MLSKLMKNTVHRAVFHIFHININNETKQSGNKQNNSLKNMLCVTKSQAKLKKNHRTKPYTVVISNG